MPVAGIGTCFSPQSLSAWWPGDLVVRVLLDLNLQALFKRCWPRLHLFLGDCFSMYYVCFRIAADLRRSAFGASSEMVLPLNAWVSLTSSEIELPVFGLDSGAGSIMVSSFCSVCCRSSDRELCECGRMLLGGVGVFNRVARAPVLFRWRLSGPPSCHTSTCGCRGSAGVVA